MEYRLRRLLLLSAVSCVLLLLTFGTAFGQQLADPNFKAIAEHPAYSKSFPRVLFDEAHNNPQIAIGSYKPFADLIMDDGYYVVRNHKSFAKESLDTFKVLVIASALGAEDIEDEGAERSAFTEEECGAVSDWIHGGGALLLIAGQEPFSGAAENIAKPFGVEMSKGFTFDPDQSQGSPSILTYSRENKLLLDHAITQGRNEAERINRVLTFAGQSLKGPDGSASFLKLADTAKEKSGRDSEKETSAAGRAQGVALKFGKGRVVVLGDAAMLSAQLAGAERRPLGMNVPGIDNKQLALNIMHWLSGLLR
jgi:hypothetical protein